MEMDQPGMVKKNLIVQKPGPTGTRREKAVYSITDRGKRILQEMRTEWKEIQNIITRLEEI